MPNLKRNAESGTMDGSGDEKDLNLEATLKTHETLIARHLKLIVATRSHAADGSVPYKILTKCLQAAEEMAQRSNTALHIFRQLQREGEMGTLEHDERATKKRRTSSRGQKPTTLVNGMGPSNEATGGQHEGIKAPTKAPQVETNPLFFVDSQPAPVDTAKLENDKRKASEVTRPAKRSRLSQETKPVVVKQDFPREDISAEVDAKLAEKERKRRERQEKKTKKRKRESDVSVDNPAGGPSDDMIMLEEESSGKPKRKKAKKTKDVELNADGEPVGGKYRAAKKRKKPVGTRKQKKAKNKK